MQSIRMSCCCVDRVVLFFLLVLLFPIIVMASDEPVWSNPQQMSDWLVYASGPILGQNDNGTTAVFWAQGQGVPATTHVAMMVRVRSPSGSWSGAENISGFLPLASLQGDSFIQTKVAPNGTPWFAWVKADGSNFVVQTFRRENRDNWQQETLSSPAVKIRGMDLHIGPDGDIGLIWVDCDTASSDFTQGNCQTRVRRRAAGGSFWTSVETLDTSSKGLAWPSLRVGPGGMMVANWARLDTAPNWKILGRACSSPTTSWQAATDVSTSVEPFDPDSAWMSAPVMGEDGTTVIAWFHKTGPNIIVKSSTKMAASSTWTPETAISANYPAHNIGAPWLAVGQDGTVAAAWERNDTIIGSGKDAIHANIRDAGGIWPSTAENLSGWQDGIDISDLAVLPDGRTIILWQEFNSGLSPKDTSVSWAHRPKSGSWNSAQVSDWMDDILNSALAGMNDDSAFAVWVDADSSLPLTGAFSVRTTDCSFSSHACGPPAVLAGGYKIAGLWHRSVHFTTTRPSASVSWFALRDTSDPFIIPPYGMFFSQWPKPFFWSQFNPAMTGAGR